jgi:hypothetical protein
MGIVMQTMRFHECCCAFFVKKACFVMIFYRKIEKKDKKE